MLNKDLKAELDKFPDDLVAEIETDNRRYEITAVDGWQDESGGKGITVWARLCGDEPPCRKEVMEENEQLRAALRELIALPGMDAHEGFPFFERIKKLANSGA